MPLVPVGDARINCYVDDLLWPWETPVPVLMHHGFSRNAKFWNPWVRELVRDHRIYRPEVRGCGESPPPPEGFEFSGEQLVSDVIAVMDHFGLEKVNWVGEHSGTLIGLLAYLLHPERIASLVLCDAPTQNPSTKTNALGEDSNAAALRKYGVGHWSRQTLDHRLDTQRASKELQDWYVEQMDTTPREVGASLTGVFHKVRVERRLEFGAVDVPVLLLTGDRSGGTYEANKQLAEELPDARLRVLDGYGEGVNVLGAEFCVGETRRFWQEAAVSA